MNAKTSKLRDLALSVVSILCLVSLWLVLSSSRPDFFPTPQMTWERFLELIEYPVSKVSILGHIWASLRRVVIAFCYAVVLGISLGIAMGWNKKSAPPLSRSLNRCARSPRSPGFPWSFCGSASVSFRKFFLFSSARLFRSSSTR